MSVECPKGWAPHLSPTVPANSNTLQAYNTYVRVTHEWELADNSTPPTCACGQSCTFNFGYGYTSEGSITITPVGIGGGIGAGVTGYTELSVNVGPNDYEYIGTVTTSGGFSSGGFLSKLKFAWRFARHGIGAVLPTLTYNAPDTTTTKHIQAAWKICKKPCG